MHDVFISYKSDDSALAMKVVNTLEASGIPCWIAERNIRAGSNYAQDIPTAIREARFFVLILTEKSQESPWVLKELDAAITQRKMILPLMVGPFQINDAMNFLLTGVQYYDATKNLNKTIRQIVQQIQEQKALVPREEQQETAPVEEEAQPAAETEINQAASEAQEKKAQPSGVYCRYCGSTEAEKAEKTLPKALRILLQILCAGVFAYLCFWIFGIIVVIIGAESTAVAVFCILGGIAGLVLGWLAPGFYEKKKLKKQLRCMHCGKVFIPRKEKS